MFKTLLYSDLYGYAKCNWNDTQVQDDEPETPEDDKQIVGTDVTYDQPETQQFDLLPSQQEVSVVQQNIPQSSSPNNDIITPSFRYMPSDVL